MDKVVYYTCFRTIKRPKLKPRPFLCFLEPTLHGRSRCFALHFSASDDFQNHPVAINYQYSVAGFHPLCNLCVIRRFGHSRLWPIERKAQTTIRRPPTLQ